MNIEHFDDLLAMARSQPTRQRLLMVFAQAQLPQDADEQQRLAFEQGRGGTLEPVFCVDKAAEELAGFEALRAEAAGMGPGWDLMFVAALSASPGQALGEAQVQAALERLVAGIQSGELGQCLPFDAQGCPVQLA